MATISKDFLAEEYKKALLTSYEKDEVFSTLALISEIYCAEVPV